MSSTVKDGFTLSEDEAQALSEAAMAFAAALPPGQDVPYLLLAEAAAGNRLGTEQIAILERVCVLALETGKARQLGGAESERLLASLYRRTPGGAALMAGAAEVSRVLGQLAGRPLDAARLTCRMPGRYQLDLTVAGVDVSIAIDPEGVVVRSLQSG